MRLYADEAAYVAYHGGTAPATVARALRTASRIVDALLRGVVYATDVDGMPTDADVIAAMSDATCAIAGEAVEAGVLEAGGSQQWESVQIGNVSLSTLQGASAGDTPTVAGVPIPSDAVMALVSIGPPTVWVR